MRFCNNCGEQISGSTSFCKKCGHQLKPSQPKAIEASTHLPNKKASARPAKQHNLPKKRTALYMLIAVALLLAAAGAGGYYYVTANSSPQPLVDSFAQALKNKDPETLSSMIVMAETNVSLSKNEWQKLVSDMHKEQRLVEKVLASVQAQQKAFEQSKNFQGSPFLFKLEKKKEKKWGLIDQYSLSLLPITFQLEVEKEAEVYVNKGSINRTGDNLRTIENIPPGNIHIKATKKGEFDTFELEESLTIWESPELPVPLEFLESYVTVKASQAGTDLYVNGKIYGKFMDDHMTIGPLNKDQSVTIQGKYTYPSGDVYTEKMVATGDETVTLKIPPEPMEEVEVEKEEPEVVTVYVDAPFNETAVKVSVMDTVFGYNSSYIHAITNLDSSLLRNAKGAQLKEATDIVADLVRRNVYYVGHLVEMKFDAASFTIENVGGTYKASVSVEETYMSGWKKASAQTSPSLQQKKYYFTYYSEYDTASGTWLVTGNKEHKGLTIRDPVYY